MNGVSGLIPRPLPSFLPRHSACAYVDQREEMMRASPMEMAVLFTTLFVAIAGYIMFDAGGLIPVNSFC
jgi:hypothetical protein